MFIKEPVKAAIWHCIEQYDYSDAVFLSERLYAEVQSDDNLFMLATAYYRSGHVDQAYYLLKKRMSTSAQCRYLLGCCAFQLKRFGEVEDIIFKNCCMNNNFDSIIGEFGDRAPFTLLLLARVCAKTERPGQAAEAFRKALKLNPFLWSAFEELCNIGEKPNPNSIFQLTGLDNWSLCHGLNINNIENIEIPVTPNQESLYITPQQQINPPRLNRNSKNCTTDESPLANPLYLSGLGILPISRIKPLRSNPDSLDSISPQPTFGHLNLESPDTFITSLGQTTLTEVNNDQNKSISKRVRAQVGHLINRKEAPLQNSKPVFSQSSNTMTLSPSTPTTINNIQANVRRSSRLFSSHSYSVKENNKSPNRSNLQFATPKSPSRKTKQRLAKCNINKTNMYTENVKNRLEKEKVETITSANCVISSNASITQQAILIQKQNAEGLMHLLRDIGAAYLQLAQFNCQAAIDLFNKLPENQYRTAWIYSMLGIAYFEMAEYENCAKCFSEVHESEPCRIKYMDIYSSALWHLQREVTLSALAQNLMEVKRDSCITWCVHGNCFSLHKEHDTAIKFLQRAVQVDSSCTYAYTLLGHEYIMTEELDKAMSCFRNAIRLNPRHYNAWFGIGTIYSKQELFQLAEVNYNTALSINPRNLVLMCHVGTVQHALKNTEKALNTLNLAINSDSKNALCKFHRGSIYFALGRHAEALKELEELTQIVPKESLVYYLIGKIHKKLGNTELALMYFSWATDLDPKGASSQIREVIDPAAGRNSVDIESPASPPEEYNSESNSVQQPDGYGGLAEDSDDSF